MYVGDSAEWAAVGTARSKAGKTRQREAKS